ncbi:MAG TPA: porin [Verrucomicrobiae bacterium]|jgi:phosphate-selective porin OprO/OprP
MITLSTNQRWLAAIILAGQVLTTGVYADPTTDQIEALKQQIQALTDKVDNLEQQHQAAARTVNTNIPFITAGATGFSLQSADRDFILKLSGFAQVDARDFFNAAPGNKDAFTIRRMRAIASGSVYHDFEYYLQTDFASGVTSSSTNDAFLQDAYVNVHHWDGFQLQIGKMKEPVSMEVLPLDQYLWFLERGFPTELAPNRDVGLKVHGILGHGVLAYQAGVFNGVPDGGSGDAEVADNDKDAVGRVIVTPFKNTEIAPLRNFSFGIGSSYGLQSGTSTPTFATVARQTFFSYSNTVSETGQHLRLDPQASYYWGPFCAYGEYAITDEKFKDSTAKLNRYANFENKAWDVVASCYLTGESNVFGVLPAVEHPFRFDLSTLGAFQLAARFGQISLDRGAFPYYAASTSAHGATSWSVALNWYLNHNVKCILEFDDTTFDGGSRTPGNVTAHNELALQGRLQFGF